jgi:glycosyltransferase involved in cell wall biosynthesis
VEQDQTIHLILPAYNEATVIEDVIREIQATIAVHILVVDDGSLDDTAEKARAMGVSVLRHPINRGAGAACQTAIILARKLEWAYLALMDADGQHVPEDLLKLKAAMDEQGADLVIGNRFMRPSAGIPRIRRFYNGLANIITVAFTTGRYSDTQSGFRLLNRRAIETINLTQDDFSFCSEMIVLAEEFDLKIVETPIRVRYTDYSVSKGQNLQVGVITAFNFLWKLIFK